MTVEEENYLKMLPLIRRKMFEQECSLEQEYGY